jgi:hypothetical protein
MNCHYHLRKTRGEGQTFCWLYQALSFDQRVRAAVSSIVYRLEEGIISLGCGHALLRTRRPQAASMFGCLQLYAEEWELGRCRRFTRRTVWGL